QVSLTSVGAAAPSMTADEGSEYKDAAQLESTPNYLATDTAQAPSRVLTASTLAPNEEVSGVVWFAGEKKLQELTLRVFVGDQIFEFPLSFAPQN
ncbi:MAG TPA: hypothetical protein VE077_11805, partial [Candidatus Methylomirabilis sp.]|nr:hypothetical protein [Candidatus Methylomirabilis sp.]